MMQPKDIQKVDLYFNPDFAKRIDRMSTILMPQKFADFQASFPKNAKMKGLTLLFHGGPGSGKTETVLQLCRKTKRPLMKIEVTDFQSKWVGESERKLKQIFTDYKTACERMEVAPILFLNECDQIIGKRVGIRNSVDQMNNALQNILLEQLEQFQGIMIGTTNLTKNLDPAYDRRFLFKIKIGAPEQLQRQTIWQSKLQFLSEQDCVSLAELSLTGGQIDNISRKCEINQVLTGTYPTLTEIEKHCEEEHSMAAKTAKTIGFRRGA
jgi:SpoVK/Ycf46/Vps4 family AAA+-type ATPase